MRGIVSTRQHSRRIAVAAIVAGVSSACAGLLGIQDPQVEPLAAVPDAGFEAALADSPSDSARIDAAGDAACPSFATLCDDFELGDLRRWGDQNNAAPSALLVNDGGPPHRGLYGLSFTTTENVVDGAVVRSGASVRSKPFTRVSAGAIAFRFYVQAPTIPADGTLAWLTKGPDDEAEAILYMSNGKWGLESIAGSLGVGAQSTGNVTFATGRWLCVEWVVDVGTSGRQQLFIDGNPEPVVTKNMDTIGDASAGLQYASIDRNNQGEVTQQLYFDDVVVAIFPTRAEGPRIGCIP